MKASEAGNTQGTQCGCVSCPIKHVPYIRKNHTGSGNGDTITPGVTGFPVLSRCMKGRNPGLLTDGKGGVRSLKEPSEHWDVVAVEVLKQKHRAGQPSESAVNSLLSRAPGRPAASEPTGPAAGSGRGPPVSPPRRGCSTLSSEAAMHWVEGLAKTEMH